MSGYQKNKKTREHKRFGKNPILRGYEDCREGRGGTGLGLTRLPCLTVGPGSRISAKPPRHRADLLGPDLTSEVNIVRSGQSI